jgi:GAF domain-containing protein
MTDDGERRQRLAELGSQFEELSRLLVSVQTGATDPGRVVELAGRAVPHAEHCGLLLVGGSMAPPALVAATGRAAELLDELQCATRQGPGFDAIDRAGVVQVDDLVAIGRWPDFVRRCVPRTGVRSVFSVPLVLSGDDRAALSFYARRPSAFDDLDVAVAVMFAPFAAVCLQSALREREIGELRMALRSSRQIGIAMGILMSRGLLTPEQAFGQLSMASQHLNRKLRDVAADVELTGQLPDLPRRRAGCVRKE